MIGPNLVHHVVVVLFFRDLLRRWKKLNNFLVFIAMCPVRCRVAILVPRVHIDILHQKHLDKVWVALSRRNMQARETLLILDVRVTATIEELLNSVLHVALSRQHQGCIMSDGFVVRLVDLGLRLEQNIDNSCILSLYCILYICKKGDKAMG